MSEFPPRGPLSVSYGEACDRGKVREENQDSIRSAAIPLGDLFIVADGIGGYQGGATASRMVAEGFLAQLATRPANYPPDHALAEACTYTNASIHAAANTGDPAFQRMGSTVVLALVQPGGAAGGNSGEVASFGPNAWIGHVGDSRAYLIRGGQMSKITNDHSAVQALINRNLITEEEARNHPDASVLTRSLGHRPEVEIEIDRVPLEAGDSLLLCSDGLWGYVADADIAAVATDPNLSVEKIAQYLLDLALSAGGHDNIGIEFIRIDGNSPALMPPVPNPSRTALRSTLPETAALPFARSAPAAAKGSGFAADPEPPHGNRRQILIGVCLLALAIGGALGLLLRNSGKIHSTDGSGGKPAVPASGGANVEPSPHHPADNKHTGKPGENQPSNPPHSQSQDTNAGGPRIIGIVGEIQLGPYRPPAPNEIATNRTTIRRETKAACASLATGETVAYVSRPDLTENLVVEAIVKSYPKVKEHVKAPEVKRKEMTAEVKTACGGDYDALVILAAKNPADATQGDPANGPVHPAETQDRPNAQLKHPHGREDF
jgi:protein phosphatase